MTTDKLVDDLASHIANIEQLKLFLETLYYHPNFGQFFQRPIISLLITGAEYLRVNLEEMKLRAVARTERVK